MQWPLRHVRQFLNDLALFCLIMLTMFFGSASAQPTESSISARRQFFSPSSVGHHDRKLPLCSHFLSMNQISNQAPDKLFVSTLAFPRMLR
jgi:hypothetical protein